MISSFPSSINTTTPLSSRLSLNTARSDDSLSRYSFRSQNSNNDNNNNGSLGSSISLSSNDFDAGSLYKKLEEIKIKEGDY
jgi:hypothetical protein